MMKIDESIINYIMTDLAVPPQRLTDKHPQDQQQVYIQFFSDKKNLGIQRDADVEKSLGLSRVKELRRLASQAMAVRPAKLSTVGAWSELSKAKANESTCVSMPHLVLEHIDMRSADLINIDIELFRGKPTDCIVRFIESIAVETTIAKIALGEPPKVSNFAARGYTQSSIPYNEPYTLAGLQGQNQIVG